MGELRTLEDFSPHVGQDFSIVGRDDRLRLVSAEAGRAPPGVPRQPFTLFFEGPHEPLLPEGLYEFDGAGGTRFALYVIPIMTAPGARQDYQVVFN